MSVVVAIKENDNIYIGADSQVTRGGTRTTLKNSNNYKVWKVRGVENCLMGHVGVSRDANIVRLIDNLVTDYDVYKDAVDFEFVVKSVVPQIYRELCRAGYISDDPVLPMLESRFLFAFKNQLYVIGSDGCVIEIEDCVAIGSGENEAIGSLLSTDGQKPEERIVKAIKASAANDIYVDYPIIMTNTKTTEFKVLQENDVAAMSKRKGGK